MRNCSFLKEKIIAHRGLHDGNKEIIENSIEAFRKAMDKDYTIELDVHILKDNTVVVFHDDNLKRLTGIDKRIKDCMYDEIKNIKLVNKNTYIPKLKDVLELVNGEVPLLIELKTDNKTGKLERRLVELLKNYKGQYAIQSFNPFSIKWFKKNNPAIIRGQLISKFKNERINKIKKYILTKMILNSITKPDFISINIHDINENKLKKIRERKCVIGWTVRTKQEYSNLKKQYDNLICELFI